ncbi:cohesin domain-containing protein [Natronorubrum sp. JWXQ-INN-674]|uniref:Cohesin domain-containing protein n=1 Tax=Natronorubrum halalkaliphilum TaxID=2691917 RepID=A0A6B0VUS0_9EURY|nr:cohesin domain-containing protein [Natronorubrum halalkaliphilum]MXV64339.1 cohesin domain-containing protein [Natronorubrum halalkaliphilum]
MGTDSRSRRSLSIAAATIVACGLVVGLLVPATVGAGDNATVFSLEPSEIEADAGETVTIDLVASSHGDLAGNGIDELSFTIEYDADAFAVTDVEHGPMLTAGDDDTEVDGSVAIDEDGGAVTVDQERTPSGDGAKSTDTAATLTLTVAEDLSPTTETLEITDAEARLINGNPQASFERDTTVHVEGGAPDDEESADDDPDGITLADDEDGDDEAVTEANETTENTDADSSGDGGDPVPGFTPLVTLGGIVALLFLFSRR